MGSGFASRRDGVPDLVLKAEEPATGSGTILLRMLKPDPMPAADLGRSALPDPEGVCRADVYEVFT